MEGAAPSAGALPPALRSLMEARFGHDFGRVRVHADRGAAAVAEAHGARALAAGHDIVFGAGEYSPATDGGRRLLAHELTHVIQQTGGKSGAGPPISAHPPHIARQPTTSTGWIGDDWSYVAYPERKIIRAARNVSSASRDMRIGTIPWITSNPNLAVDASGRASCP